MRPEQLLQNCDALKRFLPSDYSFDQDLKLEGDLAPMVDYLREYQRDFLIQQRDSIVSIMCWGRQLGKSTTLAFWAVLRMVFNPDRTVVICSNSLRNGYEILFKIDRLANELKLKHQFNKSFLRLCNNSRSVLIAPSVRTARGYSGDIILDEFAFFPEPEELYNAIIPIMASQKDYRMMIASTPNGRNFFSKLIERNKYRSMILPRSVAYERYNVPIYSEISGERITPDLAEKEAISKSEYLQNYECRFDQEVEKRVISDEILGEIIKDGVLLDDSGHFPSAVGYFGFDFAVSSDASILSGIDDEGKVYMKRLRGSIAEQSSAVQRLVQTCHSLVVDASGVGLGLYELLRKRFGSKCLGYNFSRQYTYRHQPCNAMVLLCKVLSEELIRGLRIPNEPIIIEDLEAPIYTESKVKLPHINGGHCDYFVSMGLASIGLARYKGRLKGIK